MGLDKIKDALLSVSQNVGHYEAFDQTTPYIVWAEDGQADSQWADGKMVEQTLTGTVDLFTKNLRGEPLFREIQNALNGVCSWRLNSIQYEPDNKILHYEWAWEVDADG